MAILELKAISKIYGEHFTAVDNLSLNMGDGEFIVLVGPSGCGKSTVLRMIAGLEEISAGDFLMDGQYMNHIEPQKRQLAMVFQSYALYPHLSVYENIAFPLIIRKTPKDMIDQQVQRVARVLSLADLFDRKPRELSGGQQQRVALGRAMVREPKAFLFDEPLSNLDSKLRTEMRVEISELHRRFKSNFIYVTHDQVEAMTLGQRIAVLREGKLQQFAKPEELYNQPANMFVAGFIGMPSMNFLSADLIHEGEDLLLASANFQVKLSRKQSQHFVQYSQSKVVMGIRPKDLSLSGYSHSDGFQSGIIKGKLLHREMLGDEVLYHFDVSSDLNPDQKITVKEPQKIDLDQGSNVKIFIDASKIYLFNLKSQNLILGAGAK